VHGGLDILRVLLGQLAYAALDGGGNGGGKYFNIVSE